MKLRKYFGPSSFEKEALIVAIPLMLQQVITSCVNLVDNVMVGQLGDAALSGVAAANRFYMIANFGMLGLLNAVVVYLAQFYGAKDDDKMKQSFRYMFISIMAIMIPTILLGLFVPETILRFFTDDAATIASGTTYLRMMVISLIPYAISLCISQALRALGETKTPFKIAMVTVFVNCISNYIFMFGPFGLPAFGIVGAAYGTIIARLIEAGLYTYSLTVHHQPFAFAIPTIFHIDKTLAKHITIKAIPLVANEILWSGGMAMLFKLYATRGKMVIAGYSIASTTSDIFFTLFGGMAVASTVMISHRLGAGKLDEAKRNGYYLIGLSIKLSVVFAILMFASSFFVTNFYQVSTETKEIAQHFLRVMSVMFWIYMVNTELYFILRAGGETKLTFLMDSTFMWLVNIPVVSFFAYFTNVNILILYVIGQSTDLLKMVISYIIVSKETWVRNLTIGENEEKILDEI